jgi:hypothetical protein
MIEKLRIRCMKGTTKRARRVPSLPQEHRILAENGLRREQLGYGFELRGTRSQRGVNARDVEVIVAEFVPGGRGPEKEHRHEVAPYRLEVAVRVDVDDTDHCAGRRGERAERFEHLVAEMTVGAMQERELHCAIAPRRKLTHRC